MAESNFPSIETVHEVLQNLEKLFEDRNNLLNVMFREDKYKEFLLAENIQSLVEADKRDDATNNRIKADLADGYEVLKARTSLKKFSNFISPASIPPLDLEEPVEEEDLPTQVQEKAPEPEEEEEEEQEEPATPAEPKPPSRPAPEVVPPPGYPAPSQATPTKLAEGGVVPASPMMNSLTGRPKTDATGVTATKKSSVRSLEQSGLVGKKNPVQKLVDDLGLSQYQKALAKAMGLPLKAVAAGLSGLLGRISLPGIPAFDAVQKNLGNIMRAFGLPIIKPPSISGIQNIFSNVGNFFSQIGNNVTSFLSNPLSVLSGGGTPTPSAPPDPTGGGDPETPATTTPTPRRRNRRGRYVSRPAAGGQGGPDMDLESPQAAAPPTSINTSFSSLQNSLMTSGQQMSATTNYSSSLVSSNLANVFSAGSGSVNNLQDINFLTNQVLMENEEFLYSNTENYSSVQQNIVAEASRKATMIASSGMKSMGINENNALPPTEISVSPYLLSAITITRGGETSLDIL